MVSKSYTAKFNPSSTINLYITRGPNTTDPPLRIHGGISTDSSGHTTVEGTMEPQRLPI